MAHQRGQGELTHARDFEEGFDNHRAGEEHTQDTTETGCDRNQGVTQGVAPNRTATGGALCQHGAHIVRAHLFHQRVLHHDGQEGERGHDVSRHGEHHVVGAVAEERPTTCFGGGIAFKATNGEDIPQTIHGAAQAHLQNHTYRECRHCIGREDDNTRGKVKG